MDEIRLIAIDWGTSAARAYALGADAHIVSERSAPLGVQRIRDAKFAEALATFLPDGLSDEIPLIASGMIGSRQGWIEAPYRDCPASFDAIAAALTPIPDARLRIVPGLLCRGVDGIPDVIRGEETQVFGALAHGDGERQVFVLPRTHSKWVVAGPSGIECFATFMTGELYAVLREHSILSRLATPRPDHFSSEADAAFGRGAAHSLRHDAALMHDLFSARTLALTGTLAPGSVGDYLSGLLLGAEIAGARGWLGRVGFNGAGVTLLGDAALLSRYRRALGIAGIEASLGPADAAARGLWRIARRAGMLSGE